MLREQPLPGPSKIYGVEALEKTLLTIPHLAEVHAKPGRERTGEARERFAADPYDDVIDVHDQVIGRLCAAALTLHGVAARLDSAAPMTDQIFEVIIGLDDMIGQLRISALALLSAGTGPAWTVSIAP